VSIAGTPPQVAWPAFFCSKVLFIFKMDFILIFYVHGTKDEEFDRLTSQVHKECTFRDLTEISCWILVPKFFKRPHILTSCTWRTSRWVLDRRSTALSIKAVSGTLKLISCSSVFLVTFKNLDLKKRNSAVQISDATTDCYCRTVSLLMTSIQHLSVVSIMNCSLK